MRAAMDVRAANAQLLKVQNSDVEAKLRTSSQTGCAFGDISDCGKAVYAIDRDAAEGKRYGLL